MAPGLRVADCGWREVEARLAAGAIGVLPVGAACKEHGHHLPQDTDWLQAEWLAARLLAAREVVVWPTLAYGHYPVFVDYPGSISLSEGTFRACVAEVLDGILGAGARGVLVPNTGISTIGPLLAVAAEPARSGRVAVANVYAGPAFTASRLAVEEQSFGGHADEIETSIILALHPERVQLRRARPAPTHIVRGRFNRRDPTAPNYSPDGVNGDPTLATAAKGRRLIAALEADLLAAFDAFVAGLADRGRGEGC